MIASTPAVPHDHRLDSLHGWLQRLPELGGYTLEPASSDASFRRYFRVRYGERSYIAMDAPPPQENIRPFLHVAELMAAAQVRVPRIHAAHDEQGFVLLEDFGTALYLDRLHANTADALYRDAMEMLLRLQTGVAPAQTQLADYSEAILHVEMQLFTDWFVGKLLQLPLTPEEAGSLRHCLNRLVAVILEQPAVLVHRDYHSRNLMVTPGANPGVLDFQDALVGPITYDLVSLLRDCYVAWPQARVRGWVLAYAERCRSLGLLDSAVDDRQFLRWFDLMGVQRHLKAIGIFARLKLRDGKDGYIKDIPRTLNYIILATRNQKDFKPLRLLMEQRIKPRLTEYLGANR
ncbi:MAG: aminoglycoside phosphotransferase [Methylococcaceae bacterium]|nr:MAG: aminoglycoside phosphotransferase [Methylococcaceae bacterium]